MDNFGIRAFCKIIIADFIPELHIPPAFIKKHGAFFPKTVTLQTDDDESGKLWQVKTKEKKGEYWLTQGWRKFMKDNGLDFADFCVFRFVTNSIVVVSIHDKNGCNRSNDRFYILHEEESARNQTEASSSAGESEGHSSHNGDHETADENVKFSFIWRKCMKNCMLIKASICDKIGLRKETSVQLKNMIGDVENVELFKNGRKEDRRVGLGSGWGPFVDVTKFIAGNVYEIEFIRMQNGIYQLQVSLIEH